MGLTKLAIQRPVFILMVMALIVMGGLVAFNSMRVEENPDVSFGIISISTSYPGAGAEEVNNLVTRELEEAVSGVAGLLEVTSTSQEGVSSVVLQFDVGTDTMASYWFQTETVSLDVGGRTLTLETGRMAKQAGGAVVVTYGETVVLVTRRSCVSVMRVPSCR